MGLVSQEAADSGRLLVPSAAPSGVPSQIQRLCGAKDLRDSLPSPGS